MYYIYAWYYIDTGHIFYIGKGKNNRYKEKVASRNKYFKNIITKHKDNVAVKILRAGLSEKEAFDLEKIFIKNFKAKGECEANFHEGGKGGYTGNYDDPERSKKLSAAAKKRTGSKNPMYGKTHSPEVREKLRKINLGKKLTQEHIDKIKKANHERVWTEEQKNRTRMLNLGKKMSPDEYDRMMKAVCPYEYVIYYEGNKIYSCLGHTKLWNYCKENFNISRTIIDQIIAGTWKPKFKKHQHLSQLKIIKVRRCID